MAAQAIDLRETRLLIAGAGMAGFVRRDATRGAVPRKQSTPKISKKPPPPGGVD